MRFTYPPAGSQGWHAASLLSFTAMGIRSWRIASCEGRMCGSDVAFRVDACEEERSVGDGDARLVRRTRADADEKEKNPISRLRRGVGRAFRGSFVSSAKETKACRDEGPEFPTWRAVDPRRTLFALWMETSHAVHK